MNMVSKLAAGVALSALMATGAMASDLNGSLKDAEQETSFGRNPFAGFYLGVNVGGEFANIDINDQFDGIGADGLIGGVHGGYNLCANRFCFGVYGEGGLSNVNVDFGGVDALSKDFYIQGGVKLGYMVGRATLVSVHGGYEYSEWSSDLITMGGGQDDITTGAIVLGGGIETMLSSHVSLGAKVDYLMLNSADVNNTDVTQFLEESEALRAQLLLSYRF